MIAPAFLVSALSLGLVATTAGGLLIFLGIVASAVAPTIAILATRYLDHKERKQVAVKAAEAVEKVAGVSDQLQQIEVRTAEKLEGIRVLVNGRLGDALRRIDELERERSAVALEGGEKAALAALAQQLSSAMREIDALRETRNQLEQDLAEGAEPPVGAP